MIHKYYNLVLLLLVSTSFKAVLSDEDSLKSEKSRVLDQPLSGKEHFDGDQHNPDYDHEAFLGEDEAKGFDDLTPEESKERLGEIVDKIDKDSDGTITHDELKQWIYKSQKKYIVDDVERQWKTHNPEGKEKISWDEYKKATYGFMDEVDSNISEDDGKTYKDMMKRDRRRWEKADKIKDDSLDKNEFTDFLHPEESESMRDVVVDETLEDIDKNKDGKVSVEEYINDMYSPDSGDEEVPEWVAREKEQFKAHRDKNGDGFMDRNEIRDWIIPPDFNHSDSEATHLIQEADEDKDGKLSKEEILDNYELFVGSQATDFGEALSRHDEF